jgi:hypothetical protein
LGINSNEIKFVPGITLKTCHDLSEYFLLRPSRRHSHLPVHPCPHTPTGLSMLQAGTIAFEERVFPVRSLSLDARGHGLKEKPSIPAQNSK